jgi:hypothetical protein
MPCCHELQHMQRRQSDSSQEAAAAAAAVAMDSGSEAGSPPPPRPAGLDASRQRSIELPRRSADQPRPPAAFSAESISLRPPRWVQIPLPFDTL